MVEIDLSLPNSGLPEFKVEIIKRSGMHHRTSLSVQTNPADGSYLNFNHDSISSSCRTYQRFMMIGWLDHDLFWKWPRRIRHNRLHCCKQGSSCRFKENIIHAIRRTYYMETLSSRLSQTDKSFNTSYSYFIMSYTNVLTHILCRALDHPNDTCIPKEEFLWRTTSYKSTHGGQIWVRYILCSLYKGYPNWNHG